MITSEEIRKRDIGKYLIDIANEEKERSTKGLCIACEVPMKLGSKFFEGIGFCSPECYDVWLNWYCDREGK